jgi:C-terminal processing protease CtpA/Prc
MACHAATGLAHVAHAHVQGGGAEGFILDLRNNPGGLVRSGLDIARLWMDGEAAIFNVQGREDNSHIAIMQVRVAIAIVLCLSKAR